MPEDPRKIMQYARVLKPTINLTSEASWLNCPAKCSFDVCKSGTQLVYIFTLNIRAQSKFIPEKYIHVCNYCNLQFITGSAKTTK